MGWSDEPGEIPFDDEEARPKKKKIKFPRSYVDKKHDGDPICKDCAKAEYGKLPKSKFKGPRNCWRCEELGVEPEYTDEDYESDEPSYEE